MPFFKHRQGFGYGGNAKALAFAALERMAAYRLDDRL